MSFRSLVIKHAAPLPKIENFGRFLFIGPHPDDIEVGAGATVSRLRSEGKEVSFLICTDGRYGLSNAPAGTSPEELAGIRRGESISAARILGVDDVRFLDLPDGGFYGQDELQRGIARVIGEVQPEIVFAPDPFVSSECHADHLNVGEAARRMACFAPFPEIMEKYGAQAAPVKALAYYMTAGPTRFVGTRGHTDKQLAAIMAHKSQFPGGSEELESVKTYLKLRAVSFGIRSFKGRAEGFRVLGQTHMHCLPESGR